MERLESKLPLASDFLATIVDGDLVITNDNPQPNLANDFSDIQQIAVFSGENPGEVAVAPDVNVTVNGVTNGDFVTLTGFTGDVIVDFGTVATGVDEIATFSLIAALDVPGSLEVSANNDFLVVGMDGDDGAPFTIGEDLSVTASSGSLSVGLGFVEVGDDIYLDGSAGDSDTSGAIELAFVSVGDDVGISTSAGDNSVAFLGVDVGDDLRLRAGDGADIVEGVELTVGDDLKVNLGDGDDLMVVEDATIGDTTYVRLGDGADELAMGVVDAGKALTVTGAGENNILLFELSAEYFVTVVTCNDADSVVVDTVTTRSALIFTGGGEDNVLLANLTVDRLIVLLGSGDDTLVIDGETTVNRWALLSGGSGEDSLTVGDDVDINRVLDFGFELFDPEDPFA